MHPYPVYTPGEEIANGVTHGVGIVLAIAALAVLVGFASLHGSASHIVACSVYGAALILAYTTSTLYHSIPIGRVKPLLRTLDHAAIFVLIAGTYTPFLLVSLSGPLGWILLAAIWSVALAGIVLRLVLKGRRHGLVVSLYVAMGWAVVMTIKPLSMHMEGGGIALLAAGGAAYTVGVAFYLWRRLPYHHAIWHGFVLLGSALHFFCVLLYVIP